MLLLRRITFDRKFPREKTERVEGELFGITNVSGSCRTSTYNGARVQYYRACIRRQCADINFHFGVTTKHKNAFTAPGSLRPQVRG